MRSLVLHLILGLLLVHAAPLPTSAAPASLGDRDETITTEENAAATAESRKRFLWMIALPGMLLGLAILVMAILLANRARARKLERGELPTMPE